MSDARDDPETTPAAVLSEVPNRFRAEQVIACLLVIFALGYGRGVLAPLTLAVLGSLALAPLVRVWSRLLPRWLASAVVVIGIASERCWSNYVFQVTAGAEPRCAQSHQHRRLQRLLDRALGP